MKAANIMENRYEIKMEDGSVWAVPIEIIARNRATHYADEFGGDVERSLVEDTMPLFLSVEFEVEDWAKNNMNWKDVAHHAVRINPGDVDYEDGWANGRADVVWNAEKPANQQ